jgi:hypothetical protein
VLREDVEGKIIEITHVVAAFLADGPLIVFPAPNLFKGVYALLSFFLSYLTAMFPQALASRVLAVRAASVHAPDNAAPESPVWRLPPECVVRHYHPSGGNRSKNSASNRNTPGGATVMTMVFVEKAHVAPIKVALSLARARETADDM